MRGLNIWISVLKGWRQGGGKVQGSEFFQVGTNDRRGLYSQAKEVSVQKSALK